MADPAQFIASRMSNGGIARERMDFMYNRADAADALNAQKEARAQALAEYQAALEATRLQQETQQHMDSAAFLHHFQNISHTDPHYEDKVAALSAHYPEAGGDKNVQATVAVRNTARNNYIEATKSGGAYELPEGPARDEFYSVFNKTGDFNAAKAAGKTLHDQISKVRDAVSNGYLTNEDFKATGNQGPLPFQNPTTGKYDYNSMLDLAAQRAGATTGKTSQINDRELATAQSFVTSYLKNKESQIGEPDPVSEQLYQLYSQRLLDHAKAQAATNQPSTIPQGTAPSAPPAPAGAVPSPAGAQDISGATTNTPTAITDQAGYDAMQPGQTGLWNGKLFRKPAAPPQ